MTRLLLLRHAESEWNAQGRWQGAADPPLSPRGQAQASVAGRLLQPLGFTAVVSSDLQRAISTAHRIAPQLPLAGTPAVDDGLREYDVGAWSGLTRVQIEAAWPGAIDQWRRGRLVATPGGERWDSFVARVSAAVLRVAAARSADTVLVISHGGVIRALCQSLDMPGLHFAHLAGVWIDVGGRELRVERVVSLLPPDQPETDEGEAANATPSGVLDTPGPVASLS